MTEDMGERGVSRWLAVFVSNGFGPDDIGTTFGRETEETGTFG